MQDPTRIDRTLQLLSQVWQGQPDRRLVDIAAQLQARGVTAASSDEDVAAALRLIHAQHPDAIPTDEAGRALSPVHIVTPTAQVAVDASTVIVRGHARTPQRPSVWNYRRLPGRRVAAPLAIIPADGDIPHRFGIIERIEPLINHGDSLQRSHLPALTRASIGDSVYIIDLDDGTRLELGRSLNAYQQGRRELAHTRHRWDHCAPAECGHTLRIAPPPGGPPCPTGTISAIWNVH